MCVCVCVCVCVHIRTGPGGVRAENLFGRKKADVNMAPRAIGGGAEYEMLSVDPAQAENERAEPLPYRFAMPAGFKQLVDPNTSLGTNTFVCGQDSQEFLALRGRMTVLDTTMSKIREQMEWLHQELMVLEAEKQDLTLKLSSLPLRDRSCTEFSISVHPPRPVEALPIAEEEGHDLCRRAEATAMSELPHGGEYVVLHSRQHECSGSSARSSDPAEWQAWEMHCQTGPRHVGVVVLRRKYLPDTGVRYQDVHLCMSAHLPVQALQASAAQPSALLQAASSDTLEKLRSIAGSLHAVETKWNPLRYDRIDITCNLERLQNDEGYMQFFQQHLAAPDNRPKMSDLADKVAHALAAAVHPRPAPLEEGGAALAAPGVAPSAFAHVVDEFEDSVECGDVSLPVDGPARAGGAACSLAESGEHASLAESGEHAANPVSHAAAAGAQEEEVERKGLEEVDRNLQAAWQVLRQMVVNDEYNGLLIEQQTEWFYKETPDQHDHGLSPLEEQQRQGLARCPHLPQSLQARRARLASRPRASHRVSKAP